MNSEMTWPSSSSTRGGVITAGWGWVVGVAGAGVVAGGCWPAAECGRGEQGDGGGREESGTHELLLVVRSWLREGKDCCRLRLQGWKLDREGIKFGLGICVEEVIGLGVGLVPGRFGGRPCSSRGANGWVVEVLDVLGDGEGVRVAASEEEIQGPVSPRAEEGFGRRGGGIRIFCGR